MSIDKKTETLNNLYSFLFLLQQLIDIGETASIDEVVDACDDEDIVGYIERNYNIEDLEFVPLTDTYLLNDLYKENFLNSSHDVSKRYKLNNNGLVYLVSIGISKLLLEAKN